MGLRGRDCKEKAPRSENGRLLVSIVSYGDIPDSLQLDLFVGGILEQHLKNSLFTRVWTDSGSNLLPLGPHLGKRAHAGVIVLIHRGILDQFHLAALELENLLLSWILTVAGLRLITLKDPRGKAPTLSSRANTR